MVRLDFQPILDEIAETARRIAETQRSMHEMAKTSHEAILESRALAARIEKQLRNGLKPP